jgi:hypothetical protein
MPNVAELARSELKVSAQIGVPALTGLTGASSELNMQADDPEFATALGLVLHPYDDDGASASSPRLQSTLKNILN